MDIEGYERYGNNAETYIPSLSTVDSRRNTVPCSSSSVAIVGSSGSTHSFILIYSETRRLSPSLIIKPTTDFEYSNGMYLIFRLSLYLKKETDIRFVIC